MNDLISRQDAIEYFMTNTNWHDEEGYPIDDAEEKRALLTDYFNGVPSAQQWIPCNERLPNTNGCYLVWRPHFFGGEIGMPTICYWDGSDTWHDSYGVDFTRILNKDDVTAWMPLPEPWRGEKDDKG